MIPDLFQIISLVMALVAARTLYVTVRDRRQLFDDRFTSADRQQLSQAAFFLLLPLSVLLHEAGHAIAVRAFGGTVTGFGYYVFYGYVAHEGFYTNADLFWIALSGNLVSVLLGLAALVVPLVRPARPPVNYLLFLFGTIDLLNALVFYPLMDFAGGMAGDWAQIYRRETPVLSGVTLAVHVALLLGGVLVWRSDWGRRIYATRTGLRPEIVRRVSRSQAANELLQAGERIATSWRHPLHVVADTRNDGVGVTLHWISRGYGRVVGVYAVENPRHHVELYGGIRLIDGGSTPPFQRPIALIEGAPTPDQLEPVIAQALDLVESWHAPVAQGSP